MRKNTLILVFSVQIFVCLVLYFLFMSVNTSPNPSVAGSVIAGILALGSLVVSIYSVLKTSEIQRDRELKNCAIDCLERAYEAFMNGCEDTPPTPNRVAWLTSARHIRRYERILKKIKSVEYKLVCEQEEEHWRNQFYISLIPKGGGYNGLPLQYYQCKTPENNTDDSPLEEGSVAIVYDFAAWQPDQVDEMASVNIQEIIDKGTIQKFNWALRNFLKIEDTLLESDEEG